MFRARMYATYVSSVLVPRPGPSPMHGEGSYREFFQGSGRQFCLRHVECWAPACLEEGSYRQFFLQVSRTVGPTKVVISDVVGVMFGIVSFKNGAEWICEAPRGDHGAHEVPKSVPTHKV